MSDALAPSKDPRHLLYPPHLESPEPRMVNLRQGGTLIIGQYYRIMEMLGGEARQVLRRMETIAMEEPFRLSPGCRLLQEWYGPGSPHESNPYLQHQLRNVLVFMSTLERLAAERYAPAAKGALPAARAGSPAKGGKS